MATRDAAPSTRNHDPQLLILTSLAAGAKHGYALLQDIEGFAGATLGPGTLYGAIARLEGKGLIAAEGPAGRRRPYKLTPSGLNELESTLAKMRVILDEGTVRLATHPRTALVGGTT